MIQIQFNNTISERDMDLLFVESITTDPGFCDLLLRKTDLAGKPFQVLGAELSKSDSDLGESDITVVVDVEGNKYGLLIEDKIDAIAMQEQHGRYVRRGEKGIKAGEYIGYRVFIICPKKYYENNAEAKLYEHIQTYEECKQYFDSKKDPLVTLVVFDSKALAISQELMGEIDDEMYGAILGDMIGAPYEFDRGDKTKDFPLFSKGSRFTDDSVMTVAVAEALMDSMGQSDEEIRKILVRSMQKWGRKYPYAGYGGMFRGWLEEEDPQPYGSFGNGSAMRVAAAGWLYEDLEETRHAARLTAEVTHNHPEGIKGAEATASAIYLARTGSSKEEIKDYIVREFGYDLSRTCDEIRPGYHHVETCQQTGGDYFSEIVLTFRNGRKLFMRGSDAANDGYTEIWVKMNKEVN